MPEHLRILLCSHNPLKRELGAPKVLIELGEEMAAFGWRVEFVSPLDFGMEHTVGMIAHRAFSQKLRAHLRKVAGQFDVVDYEHEYLPFPREEFSKRTLMVARSVLLVHHLQTLPLPHARGLRSLASRVLRGRRRSKERDERISKATATVMQADLVNVSNQHDKIELSRRGVEASKIVVIPFGMTRQRRESFRGVSTVAPERPVVAFVGTFDYRKGAREFPEILRRLGASVPDVRLKLLGTKGQFRNKEQVLQAFQSSLHSRLEIYPSFPADQLPALLSDCSVGIFPSHIEGFGFGVLEMLAAAMPVIAYDAPGPPMMLPHQWLVPRGNASLMAGKAADLLQDRQALTEARILARMISERFTWESAAQATDASYRAALARCRFPQDGFRLPPGSAGI